MHINLFNYCNQNLQVIYKSLIYISNLKKLYHKSEINKICNYCESSIYL